MTSTGGATTSSFEVENNINKPKTLKEGEEEEEQEQINVLEQNEREIQDGLEPNLVKKRKMIQSGKDVRIERENSIREINPESILQQLREIATYGDRCQINDESDIALELLLEYKHNAHGLVINEELLPTQKEGNELTPIIFTKKTNFVPRQGKNMHSWMIGFENYLNMVAQLYYKKNFNIREMFIIPGENKDVVVQNVLSIASNGEKKKRGRKGAQKTTNLAKDAQTQSTNDESSQKKSSNVSNHNNNNSNNNNTNCNHGRRGRPSNHHQQEKNHQANEYNFSKEEIQLSILDHLVNPLKTDYPFELWSPKEIAIFESAICKFGKQFGFVSALIGTKTHRDVFEFYLMWKGTSHYKTWKMHKNIGNRNNHSHLI